MMSIYKKAFEFVSENLQGPCDWTVQQREVHKEDNPPFVIYNEYIIFNTAVDELLKKHQSKDAPRSFSVSVDSNKAISCFYINYMHKGIFGGIISSNEISAIEFPQEYIQSRIHNVTPKG